MLEEIGETIQIILDLNQSNLKRVTIERPARKERPINSIGPNGRALTCADCGYHRHMLPNCPKSWENLFRINIAEEETPAMVMMGSETARGKKKEESVRIVMTDNDTANVLLFSGNDKQNMPQLGLEARNCAVLDCTCSSSTVRGKR